MASDNNLYLYKCPVSYKLMYWIAKNERSVKRKVGYPFLISFNKQENIEKIKKTFKYIKIDNRTIDCLSKSNCINIVHYLINKKIYNIDLGAFQINYKYHKYSIKKYFSLKENYKLACNIMSKLIYKYGYSWKTIAKYHSYNYFYQNKYLTLLANNNKKEK